MKLPKITLGLVAAAALLALSGRAEAQCFFVIGVADGRVMGPYTLSSTSTDDVNVTWSPEVDRSYSLDVALRRGPNGGGLPSMSIFINTTFCPTTNIAAGVTIRDTSNISPSNTAGAGSGLVRRSIIVTSPVSFLETKIHNADTSSSDIDVSLSETTQFSPAWSTISSFDTFYSFYNTTNATCNVSLTMVDTGGVVRTTFNGAVATGTTLSTNTSALGTARGMAGTARLTHDCPPGAILTEAAIANFSISPTPYFQFVHFQPMRESAH